MNDLMHFALSVFTGFFAIMNPIANTPIFLGLVEHEDTVGRRQIARVACITAFLITAVFVLLGKYIFELFGISISAFKIAGGLLIFYVGFELLMSKKSAVQDPENKQSHTKSYNSGIAISPLAIPILAGPGTIVTAMNHATGADFIRLSVIISVFALMIGLTYLAFILSDKVIKLVGENLIAVIGKLMGLILSIIGTGMVIAGVKLAFGLS